MCIMPLKIAIFPMKWPTSAQLFPYFPGLTGIFPLEISYFPHFNRLFLWENSISFRKIFIFFLLKQFSFSEVNACLSKGKCLLIKGKSFFSPAYMVATCLYFLWKSIFFRLRKILFPQRKCQSKPNKCPKSSLLRPES